MGNLREDSKKAYLLIHDSKSDEELNAIVRSNLLSVSYQDQYAAMRLMGEIDACQALLNMRQEKKEAAWKEDAIIELSLSDWADAQNAAKFDAILNLPAATSLNGQLVASILEEEDGLSAQDIRCWSDELTQMPDDAYAKLLSSLVAEGILAIRDEKYYLLTLCTQDLYPVDPIEWAKRVADFSNTEADTSVLSEEQLRFLTLLVSRNQPATEYDWDEFAATLPSNFKERRRPYAPSALRALKNMGILSSAPIPDTKCNFYYFKMLGKEE